MEITLTPELEKFVADDIADGAFQSAEAMVLALLELYRQKKLAYLRREIKIAIEESERGEGRTMTPELAEEIWNEAMARIEREEVTSP